LTKRSVELTFIYFKTRKMIIFIVLVLTNTVECHQYVQHFLRDYHSKNCHKTLDYHIKFHDLMNECKEDESILYSKLEIIGEHCFI